MHELTLFFGFTSAFFFSTLANVHSPDDIHTIRLG